MKNKRLISLLLSLALLCSLAAPALAADKYAGIVADAWYETAAKQTIDTGIMNGTDQGFEPHGVVTRGQIYQILHNLAGRPQEDLEKTVYTDLEGKWYANAANWAFGAGIALGQEGTAFGGDVSAVRAEVSQIISNYASSQGIHPVAVGTPISEASDYADIPVEYLVGVNFCHYSKLMVKDEAGKLNPLGYISRAEMAQVIANYTALTPSYTKEAVTIAVPEQDGIPAHDIPAIVTLPTNHGSKTAAVVMLHGTGSDKNEAGGGYALAAAELAVNGIASIRIDFMGCGESTAEYVNYNYSSAKLDAKAAADYMAKLPTVNGEQLSVMGWSQGGTNALLAAAAYPETFKAVVTWAGALSLMGNTLFPEGFDAAYAIAKKDGSYTMKFDWRGELKLGQRWFEEVKSTDVLKEVAKIKAPVLALNGDLDTVVPIENAKEIRKAAADGVGMGVIGADHTFNIFTGDLSYFDTLTTYTAEFLYGKLLNHTFGMVESVSKYGNIVVTVMSDALTMLGYTPGDILAVSVNEKTVNVPYGNGYSNVDTGKEILVPDKGGYIALAVNMGSFAEKYGVKVGDRVVFTMAEKAGYLEEYEIRNIDSKRSNERADYTSDEVFANFRPVVMGKIPAGVLYRSSSPVNPELGRNTYVDALIETAGVKTVLNLADDKAGMNAYEGYGKSYYATLKVIPLNMGVDFNSAEFHEKLKLGFAFILANKGPYLIHCNEGKDRAGFTVTLLEALMGGKLEEIKSDYMISFENYYHVEQGSDQWNKIAESNVLANLRIIAGLEAKADLKKVDLQKAAESYLIETLGVTTARVSALKTALSTPSA